jgi:hypothetical protein
MAHTVRGDRQVADGRQRHWTQPKFMRDLHRRERRAEDRKVLAEELAQVAEAA